MPELLIYRSPFEKAMMDLWWQRPAIALGDWGQWRRARREAGA